MKIADNTIVYSPSDLSTYHRSRFASYIDRIEREWPEILDELKGIPEEDPLLRLFARQGDRHEEAVLRTLIAQHGEANVVEIDKNTPQAKEATNQAMAQGVPVICQAALSRDNFAGYADFLLKVDTPSNLGDYSYQVWDAKLSKSARTEHVLQVCAYAWMLEPILGKVEEFGGFYLGSGEHKSIRIPEFYGYFRSVKHQFTSFHGDIKANIEAIPDPAMEQDHGRWSDLAARLMDASDSLSQVAGIRISQITNLVKEQILTVGDLATTNKTSISGMGERSLAILKQQAALQLASKYKDTPDYSLLPEEQGKGFQTLPPAHAADIFFDIEGHPLLDGGLEYLWGATLRADGIDSGVPTGDRYPFLEWWAHDRPQEKRLIEDFVDWVHERWSSNPGMHIYHYAPYEITALKKLTGRFNTRIDKLDDLLRAHVFVDLYRVVKQSMIIGAPGYSIKQVEHLYGREHAGPVANGAASVVDYENWRQEAGVDSNGAETPLGWQGSETLSAIRDYNIEDCESTLELYDWLSGVKQQAGLDYVEPGRDASGRASKSAEATELQILQGKLSEQFEASEQLQSDTIARGLNDLLEFHIREDKPMWWAYFDRLASSEQELHNNDLARVGASVVSKDVSGALLKLNVRYDIEQNLRKDKFNSILIRELDGVKANGFSFEKAEGQITLSLDNGRFKSIPEVLTLIGVETMIKTTGIQASLANITKDYYVSRQLPPTLRQILKGEVPLFAQSDWPLERISTTSDSAWLEQISRTVAAMQGSVLTIQGPPGAGKTYTASHIIKDLVEKGKRVGIMSNSHAAVLNLQTAVSQLAPDVRSVKIGGADQNQATFRERFPKEDYPALDYRPQANFANRNPYESYQVIGATAFAYVKPFASDHPLDFLFVDEASQVSMANLASVTPASENIVLMGDQMQLEQPIQGTHPGIAGTSALEHLLGDNAIVPADKGIFLDKTYRMHPDVCGPISEIVYQGKLTAASGREKQQVIWPGPENAIRATGIEYVPVEHSTNTQESIEEVNRIREILAQLEGGQLTDKDGYERAFNKDDILIVAPYNMQVNLLKNALGDTYRIGTIDKFQGQEAQVVIVSMASSLPAESARGIDFLFDVNRLNVAVSRAKALAIIVASPNLQEARANSVEQARKLGAYFRLIGQAA